MRLADKFAAPWTVRATEDGFAVDSAGGPTVARIHYVEGDMRLSEEEAFAVATVIARLPVLLARPRY